MLNFKNSSSHIVISTFQMEHKESEQFIVVSCAVAINSFHSCKSMTLQCNFCHACYQEMAFISSPVESGLALKLILTNRMQQKWASRISEDRSQLALEMLLSGALDFERKGAQPQAMPVSMKCQTLQCSHLRSSNSRGRTKCK